MAIRVLVVDDHPVFRAGLCALLSAFDGVEVVGEAACGAEAVETVARTVPDVVVMDLHMPAFGGIGATRAIRETHPRAAVLVLTMFDDDDSVFAAMRAGARGYLLKEADAVEVFTAIRAVAGGEAIFGPGIAHRLIGYFAAATHPPAVVFPELTEGERAVLDLIAAGHSNADIARLLTLSLKTVRNRVSTIFSKLQVADRAQAIVRGRAAGLGGHPDGALDARRRPAAR